MWIFQCLSSLSCVGGVHSADKSLGCRNGEELWPTIAPPLGYLSQGANRRHPAHETRDSEHTGTISLTSLQRHQYRWGGRFHNGTTQSLFHACMSGGFAHTRVLHNVCDNRLDMTEITALNMENFELVTYYELWYCVGLYTVDPRLSEPRLSEPSIIRIDGSSKIIIFIINKH